MGYKKPDYIVFIHRIFKGEHVKKGGVDIFIEYLVSKGHTILLIEFPLRYKSYNKFKVKLKDKQGETLLQDKSTISSNEILCWIIEFFYSIYYALKYKTRDSVAISADPLTSFPAILLNKIGYFKYHYYQAVDYSRKRFENSFINSIYVKMLNFSIRHSDLVGAVSLPMNEKLEKHGPKQTFYLPNSVDYKNFAKHRIPVNKRKRYSLVATCADVSDKLFMIFDFIKLTNNLKKVFPKVTLDIIGPHVLDPDHYKKMVKYIKNNNLRKNVTFHGLVPKSQNIEIISKCMLGLAYHDNSISHVEFADSLKIREYAALGVPIIANKATSTSSEMSEYEAGRLIPCATDAVEEITQLFKDKKRYVKLHKNALEWSKKRDKRKYLDNLMDLIDSSSRK